MNETSGRRRNILGYGAPPHSINTQLETSLSAVTIHPASSKGSESDRDGNTELDSPLSTEGALLFTARPGALARRVSSDNDTETLACSSDFGSTTPTYFEGGSVVLRPTPRHKIARAVGEEEVPYLTSLLLRAVRVVPFAQYVLHPRVVCVLGCIAFVGLGVGYTVLSKLLDDDLGLHFPYAMQLLVQVMAAVMLEAFSHQYGMFSRTGQIRTARLLPLTALYGVSVVLSHCARQVNSVHGTYQITQAFLPAVVMVMMGSTATVYAAGRRHQRPGKNCRTSLLVFLKRMANRFVDQGRDALGHSSSSVMDLPLFASSDLADDFDASVASVRDSKPQRVARWLTLPVAVAMALALWAPAFHMVAMLEPETGLSTSLGLARSMLNILLSLASLLVNASLLVGISDHLQQHPGLSAAAFLRHFTPLCTLVLLVLWPVLEAPVNTLETVWLGPTPALRVVLSCVGVAALGALSYLAKIALLRSAVSDGPVGVAMVGQIHTIICLAIGWWSYGYAHWGLQVLGFYAAVVCLAVWAASRITANVGNLVPVLSSHSFKTTRSRKLSSAIF